MCAICGLNSGATSAGVIAHREIRLSRRSRAYPRSQFIFVSPHRNFPHMARAIRAANTRIQFVPISPSAIRHPNPRTQFVPISPSKIRPHIFKRSSSLVHRSPSAFSPSNSGTQFVPIFPSAIRPANPHTYFVPISHAQFVPQILARNSSKQSPNAISRANNLSPYPRVQSIPQILLICPACL